MRPMRALLNAICGFTLAASVWLAAMSLVHFEGYVLIIGVALVIQSLLTAVHLIPAVFGPSSKVHQFGN